MAGTDILRLNMIIDERDQEIRRLTEQLRVAREAELLTKDCAMLLRMFLVSKNPEKLKVKVADFLRRKGLMGGLLRTDEKALAITQEKP